MRSLLVIYNPATAKERKAATASKTHLPETVMRSCGYAVTTADTEESARKLVAEADAAILHLPIPEIGAWSAKLLQWKTIPLLWWCSETTATLSVEACEDRIMTDGVISSSMQPAEIHWSLHFGAKMCFERQQWQLERQQLLSKIEERKWIDIAKGILCEIKNISEAEAYDILRKQAMNERKRMVDVAASIVNVYNLLQEQKLGRTKR
ncbi:ANTAR domain-containing response regulator [Cohnella zeiphila]|uniref:ANTAR domain-containing protein n=1 Tax=Cohnella zeiphila TaxID=2761120 RepID=A0A7X0SRJ6_9BACL|nr:ANTAR domain-containing protein [Cohnella zeiphila]MBB6734848.1 ANTAR domain-containing protein [Cohnella zeiphila]